MAVVTTLPDAAYSWWVLPLAVNLDNVTFVGSVSADGINRVDRIDWATGARSSVTLDGPHSADEHNPTALAVSGTQDELIAFYPRHGEDSHIRYQFIDWTTMEAGAQQTLTFSAGISYAQVLQVPNSDTLHVFCRRGGSTWAYRTSTDWGASWGSEKVLIDSSELTGTLYTMLRPDPVTPTVAHMVSYIRANSGTFHDLCYARINLSTGAITTAAGGSIGDLDEASGPDLDLDNELTRAVSTSDNTRPMDIGAIDGQPAIAYALWVGDEGAPTYRVARFNGSTWDDVAVVASGEEFGHDPDARYIGGMAFGRTADEDGVLRTSRQTVPDPGEWVLEEWLWDGSAFGLTGEVARTPNETPIIRPMTVHGDGRGIWMHEYVTSYLGFTSYSGDLRVYGTLLPPAAAPGALLRTIAGSHSVRIEARVVTGHPTGEDPDGTEIEVLGGDVVWDGTAEVRASATLHTLGISGDTGKSRFPRFVDDLLAPYGREVFLRYGVDLGGAGTLWTPLGYFRIERNSQSRAPFGAIAIDGRDRMARIIKAELLAPRMFRANQTLGSVADNLIREIFPSAAILWDDDSDLDQLGRRLVVKRSRFEALKDIAESRGKLFYVDDAGAFRFDAAPDEATPLWEVRAGHDGVLIEPSREISTLDTPNAIMFVGQGIDDEEAVHTVVYDGNPQSPTYFFGEFGQVVERHETPLVKTGTGAVTAAVAKLRSRLGATYQVDFQAVTNPTLRPWHPVRVTYRDGNREIHVMQRVRVPLARQAMTGTTRQRILATIGSLS